MTRRSLRFITDDPAPPTRAEQLAGMPLFDETPARDERRPEVAARGCEQQTMPIEGTDIGWYQRWRQDPRAERVLEALRAEALRRHRAEPLRKIGPRNTWERVRMLLEPEGLSGFCDNRAQAMACREVEATTLELAGRFRHRVLRESEAAA